MKLGYLNSHTLVIEFPAVSISSAKTPTMLFRKDNCPLEVVFELKNTEPWFLNLPSEPYCPIAWKVYVAISPVAIEVSIPLPSLYDVPSEFMIVCKVPISVAFMPPLIVAFPMKDASILGPVFGVPKSRTLKLIEVAGPSTIKSPIVTLIAKEGSGVARLVFCPCASAYGTLSGVVSIMLPPITVSGSRINGARIDILYIVLR